MTATRGRGARNKGANAERELARILTELTGKEIRRGQVFNHEPDIVGLDGIHVEAKRQETLKLTQWFEQAEAAARKHRDGLPAVFFRRNGEHWKVVMDLKDWACLYRGWRRR